MDFLSQSYFGVFGLPETFDVDLSVLAERYRAIQRQIHPDRYAHGTAQQRRVSMQRAAYLNEAYRVLKNPLERATYLLGRRGFSVSARGGTTTDTAFLMEQLELREELEAVRGDPAPAARLADLVEELEGRISALQGALSVALADASRSELERAREMVLKLQFLDKLRRSADDLEAELAERA